MKDVEILYSLINKLALLFGPIIGTIVLVLLVIIISILLFFIYRIKNTADEISKRAISQFELTLNQDLEKYKIDYSALIQRRAEIIQNIYQLLVCIEDTQIDNKFGKEGIPFPGNYTDKNGNSVVDGMKNSMTIDDKLLDISNSLYSLYNINKIYFSQTTCIIFDELIKNLHVFWENVGQKQMSIMKLKKVEDPYEYHDLVIKMGMTIEKEKIFIEAGENIKKIKLQIEQEFRNLLSIK